MYVNRMLVLKRQKSALHKKPKEKKERRRRESEKYVTLASGIKNIGLLFVDCVGDVGFEKDVLMSKHLRSSNF